MSKPNDWQILAVALLLRLGGKVELSMSDLVNAHERLDPIAYETLLVSYRASLLESETLTVELRSRPRATANEALDAFLDEVLRGTT